MSDSDISRREILSQLGAAGVGAATLGVGTAAADETDEYNVGTASPAAEQAARNKAKSVKRVLDWEGDKKTVTGRFSEEAIDNLEKRKDVRYTEVNGEMHAIGQTLPWGINRVDADKAHGDGFTGKGADIAIIDTGLDSDHPDLNIAGGKCFADECCGEATGGIFGCDDNTNDCNYAWDDDNDHGTHVGGTADAIDNSEDVVGVSTEATLHAAKVLNGCGSGSYSNVAAGIEWVADQGYDVGNMSLGGDDSSTVQDACQYAYDKRVLLVAAAGNDGPCSDCVGYPAAYSTVIAVSATTKDDQLADFSSTGPEVELAAPGKDVLSTVPPESSSDGTDTFSGTSMASPHVAGAGGLVMAEGQSNTEARSTLQDTAEDIGLSDNEQGYGLVDAEAAVGSLSSDPSPTVESLSASEVETSDGDAEFDVSWDVSDDEGDLSSVDLALTDDTDGESEDSANKSVSGSSASGTTRLVAGGDEGTGNSYTVELTVTDSNNNSTTDSTSISESEDAPTVDSLSVSEVETSDSDAEFDVSWDVSDADSDLSSVDLALTDDTDGESEDSANKSVSGSSASGTTRLVASGDDGSGNSYTVTATVTDTDGTSKSSSTSFSESENSAPSASIDSITDTSNPAWERYEVDWSASDSDGNLDSVVVEMLDSSGNVLDSVTNDVSGSSASGVDEVRSKQNGTEIVVTATDTAGDSGSDSQSI